MEYFSISDFVNNFDDYKRNATTTELLNNLDIARFMIQSFKKRYKGGLWDVFVSTNLVVRFNPEDGMVETWEKKEISPDVFEVIDSVFKIDFGEVLTIESKIVTSRIMQYKERYQVLLEAVASLEKYTKDGLQIEKARNVTYNPSPFYVTKRDLANYRDFSQAMFTGNFEKNINGRVSDFESFNDRVIVEMISPALRVDRSEVGDYAVIYSKYRKDDLISRVSFPLFYNPDGTIMITPFKDNPMLQLPASNLAGWSANKITISNHDGVAAKKYLERRQKLMQDLVNGSSRLQEARDEVAKLVLRSGEE